MSVFSLLVAKISSKIDKTFWVCLFFDVESKSISHFSIGCTNSMRSAGIYWNFLRCLIQKFEIDKIVSKFAQFLAQMYFIGYFVGLV